jgi:hypothetical protein
MSRKTSHAKSALFWDESFLWGLLAHKALTEAGLPFELLCSADIRQGRLKDYGMLFVPGGWASNKMKSLGEEGLSAIRSFVEDGGSYLGLCGGAGLATHDGIGLISVKRKPTAERVPSFSGKIALRLEPHPLWKGLMPAKEARTGRSAPDPGAAASGGELLSAVFQAWWPSQLIAEGEGVKILATFGEALPDSFSSDLNVGDVGAHGDWQRLEDLYRINLNPARLRGEAAVIEGRYGKGKVIVSLVHFDTPDDPNGTTVLRNLWDYLSGGKAGERKRKRGRRNGNTADPSSSSADPRVAGIVSAVDDLISLGTRNFLWFWRTPMFLQWRRGVRGLEYCTLAVMIRELATLLQEQGGIAVLEDSGAPALPPHFEVRFNKAKDLLLPFLDKAGRLLVLEREAMQKGAITYEHCDDPAIREMRTELFSRAKSHGGLFKELLDEVDALLFALLSTKSE